MSTRPGSRSAPRPTRRRSTRRKPPSRPSSPRRSRRHRGRTRRRAASALGAAAGPVTLIVTCLGLGALSYQTRRAVEGAPVPPASEALAFARRHGVALVLAPILVSLLALVPPILLAIKGAISHIPTIGPT